ncbi:Glucose--fructose oxidoreductase precursor [Rosistilla carotiformis]|uniref:Glucose--fructose oxidoreductase n=1 Tax=Rosistilla carotiformis TaxID=2528017 RepID=A0A518JZ41_9BACT|nr:Gfo/Idh/MocA family oxidoreductase [Rosistilla carotiformis]QDV70785.1 Glucose--fructose oxidoreductase precursor [Rosistilla carotiformis]
MVDKLSDEARQIGSANYYEAVGVTRRDFLQGVVAAGAVSGAGLGAMYFGYDKVTDPVRIGVIGTGDEGSVLIGGCNPDYVTVKAICDIRPYNVHRAFHGDVSSPAAQAARPGLIKQYGYKSEAEARKEVQVYDSSNGGIQAILDDPDIEAIIIALPLFLHAPVAIQAMMRGKHVLTEKLMAHSVAQCKAMARGAQEMTTKGGDPLHLATGHQRHYSVKYDNAINLMRWGMLGQIHHIRAQWHRGNVPGADSWKMPLPGGEAINGTSKRYDKIADQLGSMKRKLDAETDPATAELWAKKIAQWEAWDADKGVDASGHGYEDGSIGDRVRPALEELCRWRLFDRTGGGLMAELGSHQLDAATIFLSSLRNDGKKAHPLSVSAVGGRHIFPHDRDVDDHVYCMFEFPGPEYDPKFGIKYYDRVENYPNPKGEIEGYNTDPSKKVVVTYSTINGNGFGGYGEVVMGTKGTLVLEKEKDVYLYKDSNTSAKVGVKKDGDMAAMDTQASGSMAAPVAQAADSGPVSRGYNEEIEHWAYCIRNPSPENRPRCYPEVAMGDAVIALSTNVAIKNANQGKGGYLQFDPEWFERDSDKTPDGSDVAAEMKALKDWKPV